MTSVTMPTGLGASGNTYSDDDDPTTGLANGGHRTRFVPLVVDTLAIAQTVKVMAEANVPDAPTRMNLILVGL